ncbi:MAG: RluA family pseudouridine synthase [Candidatus Omnitrophica bacterium]|nr:RluA family pseudouridine synthase [Candidatus Omnitrophota bacterium]
MAIISKFTWTVTSADAGERLDRYLTGRLTNESEPQGSISRSYIQSLITEEKVLLNGKPTKSHHIIHEGDRIETELPEPKKIALLPEDIPLDIVFEDEHIIVVNKPAGLVVHPAPGHYTGTLVNAILHHCSDFYQNAEGFRPGIVHRLDKDTSGLLVVAKDEGILRILAKQFKKRTIKRKYIALVKGVIQLDEGDIKLPIGRDKRNRQKMAVTYTLGKEAITHYKVLKRFKDWTMVELTLGTGRTHQIRVHMAYIGHPLLGDSRYGGAGKISRQALHAQTLGFYHPVTQEYMEFSSPIPRDMEEFICG